MVVRLSSRIRAANRAWIARFGRITPLRNATGGAGGVQIGQCRGHEQAIEVLLEPATAHLGEAEHPLDDPDRMLDLGPHLRLGAVLRSFDFVHHAAMAIAAVDKIARPWRAAPDRRPL